MQAEIQQELKRVVGGPGVSASAIENREPANPRVKLETANAVYHLPANRFLSLLRVLPDQIGINALRQSIDQHFESTE